MDMRSLNRYILWVGQSVTDKIWIRYRFCETILAINRDHRRESSCRKKGHHRGKNDSCFTSKVERVGRIWCALIKRTRAGMLLTDFGQ